MDEDQNRSFVRFCGSPVFLPRSCCVRSCQRDVRDCRRLCGMAGSQVSCRLGQAPEIDARRGCKVDLGTANGLKCRIRAHVMATCVRIV